MPVSDERRAALRAFFEEVQRGQGSGVTFVEVTDILGVLDDLDLAEKRERISCKALEDILNLGGSEREQQAKAVISWRRLMEIEALDAQLRAVLGRES